MLKLDERSVPPIWLDSEVVLSTPSQRIVGEGYNIAHLLKACTRRMGYIRYLIMQPE